MIKSKIDARERALELAESMFAKMEAFTKEDFFSMTKEIEDYLIGSADLPEFQSDGDLVKAFLDIANNELEKSRDKNSRELEELIKTLQGGNAGMAMGISGVPVQPDAE